MNKIQCVRAKSVTIEQARRNLSIVHIFVYYSDIRSTLYNNGDRIKF